MFNNLVAKAGVKINLKFPGGMSMTKHQPLVLENRDGGHKVNLSNVNPYLAAAALTAAILDEAGDDPLTMHGNDRHWGKFVEFGKFLGADLDKISWGAHSLKEETIIRAKWGPAGIPLLKNKTAGVHLKRVRKEVGSKEYRHFIVLTKITPPKDPATKAKYICGRMDIANAQRLVEKANGYLAARG